MIKNKKAALEMSVGTIVTIVLMVSMLILGLVLIRTIFGAGKSAINQIDAKTKSQIDQLFKEDEKKMIVPVPTDRKVTINQGANQEGFGFVLRNTYNTPMDFKYSIHVKDSYDPRKCDGLTSTEIENWLVAGTEDTISLGGGKVQENGALILFNIPNAAPAPCTIPFIIKVCKGTSTACTSTTSNFYTSVDMFMTIQGE